MNIFGIGPKIAISGVLSIAATLIIGLRMKHNCSLACFEGKSDNTGKRSRVSRSLFLA